MSHKTLCSASACSSGSSCQETGSFRFTPALRCSARRQPQLDRQGRAGQGRAGQGRAGQPIGLCRNLLLNICDDALLQRLDRLFVDHLRCRIAIESLTDVTMSSRDFLLIRCLSPTDPQILRGVPLPPLLIQRGPSRWTSLAMLCLPLLLSCDHDHVVQMFRLAE